MCLLVFLSNNLYAQFTSQAFFEGFGTRGLQEMFYKSSVIQSSNGYTYMCGASINTSGDYDMLLTKFDTQQQEVWSVTYAGLAGGDDYAADLIEDANGNIFITGAEYISATNYDAVTIKYNSQGVQQWVKTYDGIGLYDSGVSLALDAVENVYICGGSYEGANLSDFLVVKYTNAGLMQWANTWNGTNNLQDVAARIEIRGAYLSAVGGTQTTQNKWEMATLKMSISSGQIAATTVSGGDASGIDKVADLAIDDLDNTYLVGAVKNNGSAYDIRVIKLDSDLSIVWQQDYDGGSNEDDEGLSLELTSTNDVIICGFTTQTGEGKNMVTQKYANANGTLLWTSTYDNQNGDDEAVTVKVTDSDDVIVFGSTYQDGNLDFALQCLKGTNGNTKWETTWNGDNNADDVPSEIAIDGDDIYAAGQSYDSDGLYQYVITKWNVKEYAATKPDGRKTPNGFIENRGQLQNNDGTTNNYIDYYIPSQWPGTYVSDDKVSYVWSKRDSIGPDTTTYHRIDMAFKKGNTSAKVYPTEKLDHYTNIYLGYLPNKLERAAHYSSVTKIEAYTNTDIIYTSHSQGYRHHIVAKQGAPTADFEMEYDGYDSMTLDASGNLVFGTTFGDHVQSKAKVYNMNPNTGELFELNWQPDYVITGNKVSFSFPQTWTGTLVIEIEKEQAGAAGGGGLVDPGNIDWSTNYGNEGSEAILDSDTKNGFLFTCGFGELESFPLLLGSDELAFNCIECSGQLVGTVQAFDNDDCSNKYSIIIGGNFQDVIGNLAIHPSINEVFFSGNGRRIGKNAAEFFTIGKPGRYENLTPTSPPQISYTFLSSFVGTTGELEWSTYMTSKDDMDYSPDFPLVFSEDEELYMCGHGVNSIGDLAEGTGFDWLDLNPLEQNGFVFRFFEDLSDISWSTEFGSNCFVEDAVFTPAKDIVIVGSMDDSSISEFDELETDGQDTFPYEGGMDGYAIVFDSDNEQDWFTWLGSTGDDEITAVASNGINLYFGGTTEGTDFPYMQPGSVDQHYVTGSNGEYSFLTEFNDDILAWSTLLTANGDSEVRDIFAVNSDEIYITGVTFMANLPTVELFDAYNSSLVNGTGIEGDSYLIDSYLWKFDNKVPTWVSYLGGNVLDQSQSLAFSEDNLLFVSGYSHSDVLFPWWDFDGEDSEVAYYDEQNNQVNDKFITRLDMNIIVTDINEFNDDTTSSQIFIYPNPSSEYILIQIPQKSGKVDLKIYDSSGRIVYARNNFYLQEVSNLNVSHLNSGVYHLAVQNSKRILSTSFIKKD